ncbi:MAG: tetratricopeptide repeat protein, partial [Thioploca sp.]|nr:tetratricopeptide repeat protein [Thioploca sp.]
EQILGADHPATALSLNNLASLLRDQGNYAAAEPLYRRALAILETKLPPNHPNIITVRNNLSQLLKQKS